MISPSEGVSRQRLTLAERFVPFSYPWTAHCAAHLLSEGPSWHRTTLGGLFAPSTYPWRAFRGTAWHEMASKGRFCTAAKNQQGSEQVL